MRIVAHIVDMFGLSDLKVESILRVIRMLNIVLHQKDDMQTFPFDLTSPSEQKGAFQNNLGFQMLRYDGTSRGCCFRCGYDLS